jgi:mRNA interferase HicA
MKRQELERHLRALGWTFQRHGRRHDLWGRGKRQEAVPRHDDINERLARAILARAEQKD